jgi:hypothetical protein
MRSSFAAHGRVMLLAILAYSVAIGPSGPPASWAQNRPAGGTAQKKPDKQKPAKPARRGRAAKPAPAATADDPAADAAAQAAVPAGDAQAPPEPAPEELEAMPDNLRLRRLEQRVQELKERAWRTKARVSMLEEAVLGAGVGANATIVHVDKMGSSYELVQLVYNLDGTQIFARKADSGALDELEDIEVLSGPLSPGSHTVSVLAVYQGRGYGVFKYMNKYKFTVRSSHTFTANEGKATRIEAVAFERGNVTTPIQQRPAIDFKISYGDPRKAEAKP